MFIGRSSSHWVIFRVVLIWVLSIVFPRNGHCIVYTDNEELNAVIRQSITDDDSLDAINGDSFGTMYTGIGTTYVGTESGDTIYGGYPGDDYYYLLGGNDLVVENSGHDTYEGGTGNDLIFDRGGNDTYRFFLGDGNDAIYDLSGNDSIVFGNGISIQDAIFTRIDDDVQISFNGLNDSILIKWWFGTSYPDYDDNDFRIELIKFSDGTYYTSEEVEDILAGISNQAPVANAGEGQTLHVGSLVTLDGSLSSDPDENYSLTYAWSFVSRPAGSIAALSDPRVVNPSFTADKAGNYTIQLIVTDRRGAASLPSTVAISTWNTAPVAEAGDDQVIITKGSLIQLNGTQSYDLDGDPITYAWSIRVRPSGSTASLSDVHSPMPTITPDAYGIYIIDLVVSDLWVSSPADSVTLSFDNIKPVANAGQNQSLVIGDTAYLDGSASNDANGDILSYLWSIVSMPAGSNASVANPSTAQTSFIPDLPGMYVVSLVVNDGQLNSDPSNITIMVTSNLTVLLQTLQDAIDCVNFWGGDVCKNKNMANTLTNKLNAVIQMVEEGQYADALDKLRNDILNKTDGCATAGAPDKNDWILKCNVQNELHQSIMQAIGMLEGM